MDGIKDYAGTKILVMAATNRLDMLDPALLRPGRFDRVVQVELPDQESRYQILKLHTGNKPLADDVDLTKLPGYVRLFGAHLENLANEAAILALRENNNIINQRHLIESIDKVCLGEKLDRRPQKEELWRIAIHEVGHAVVSEVLKPGSVAALTIVSRGQALGYTRQTPDDDYYLYTETYLRKQLQVCWPVWQQKKSSLELEITGAQGDLEQAVTIAKKMIQAGMSSLELVSIVDMSNTDLHKTVGDILNREKQAAECILREQQTKVIVLAHQLMEKERLEGKELRISLAQTDVSDDSNTKKMLAV